MLKVNVTTLCVRLIKSAFPLLRWSVSAKKVFCPMKTTLVKISTSAQKTHVMTMQHVRTWLVDMTAFVIRASMEMEHSVYKATVQKTSVLKMKNGSQLLISTVNVKTDSSVISCNCASIRTSVSKVYITFVTKMQSVRTQKVVMSALASRDTMETVKFVPGVSVPMMCVH